MRLDTQAFDLIDDWRAKEADLPNRSEAIRRLVHKGLAASDRQAFTNAKLQIMLAARQPDSGDYLSDAFVFAFTNDVYPAFNQAHELWAEPYESCFEITKEMMISLGNHLDDLWRRRQATTFYELEKNYKSKDWSRGKLILACRYLWLNRMFMDLFWDSFLSPGEYPIEAESISKTFHRNEIFIA